MKTHLDTSKKLGPPLTRWEKLAAFLSAFTSRSSAAVIRARVTQNLPGMWDNLPSTKLETIRRHLILILNGALPFLPGSREAGLGIFSLITFLTAAILKQISLWLYPKTHSYIAGHAAEVAPASHTFTLCTLNPCMFWGGLPIKHGGLSPAHKRIKPLGATLRKAGADLIVCQEVSLTSALLIIDELKEEYAHFFTDIGPFPWRLESCLFVASKLPIVSPPQWVPFPDQHLMKRSFFCVETPSFWAITTHMQPGYSKEAHKKRHEQLNMITEKMKKLEKTSGKPCILIGDLNIERIEGDNDPYIKAKIPEHYLDPYAKHPLSPETATCTNLLMEYAYGQPVHKKKQRHDWEINDYALMMKTQKERIRRFEIELIPTFQLDAKHQLTDPAHALTDHRGLLVKLDIATPEKPVKLSQKIKWNR